MMIAQPSKNKNKINIQTNLLLTIECHSFDYSCSRKGDDDTDDDDVPDKILTSFVESFAGPQNFIWPRSSVM